MGIRFFLLVSLLLLFDLQGAEAAPKQVVHNLKDGWYFLPQQFADFEEIDQLSEDLPIKVPGNWNSFFEDGKGFGTYYRRLDGKLLESREELALEVVKASLAYEVYLNHRLIGKRGKVAQDKEGYQPALAYAIHRIPVEAIQSENLLIFHISNFDHQNAGLWMAPRLSTHEKLTAEKVSWVAINLFVFGCLLALAIYHLYTFLIRPKNTYGIYFFLVCLSLIAQKLADGKFPILTVFPDLPWNVILTTNYTAVPVIGVSILLFISSLYPVLVSKKWLKALVILGLGLASTILLLPPYWGVRIMQFAQLYVLGIGLSTLVLLALSLRRKLLGSRGMLLAALVFFLAGVNDVLLANEIIDSFVMSHFGVLVFMFTMSTIISRKSLANEEALSSELHEANIQLEQKVQEATTEVKEQNQLLQHAISETQEIIVNTLETGNFSNRIEVSTKEGEWRQLGENINQLFEMVEVPYRKIDTIVEAMSVGDLSKRYETSDTKGDFLVLGNALNQSLDSFSELLQEIIHQVNVIQGSTKEMSITGKEIDTSSGEIATEMSYMSNGARDQVIRTDESSTLIEGIMTSSEQMSEQANSINHAASSGVSESEKGSTIIAKMADSMQKMLHASSETQASVKVLEQRNQEIVQVLNLIKDVAKETNLLALNAGIQAADAKEAGRGFSVIAEQIRKLSENANNSVKEIEVLIGDAQNATKTTAGLIEKMQSDIDVGASASHEVITTFQGISTSCSDTLQLAQEIVGATQHQSTNMKQLVNLSGEVLSIAEKTAKGSEQVAASSSQLSSGMKEYSKRVQLVSEVSEQLKQKVQAFKL